MIYKKLGVIVVVTAIGTVTSVSGQDNVGSSDVVRAPKGQKKLTPAMQMEIAGRIRERGYNLSRRIGGMVDESKKEADIIRVNCLDGSLAQINANVRTVDQRYNSLKNAIAAGDSSRGNHEFNVISIVGQKFDNLEVDSGQCLGKDVYESKGSQVTVTIDYRTIPIENSNNVAPPPPPAPLPIVPPPSTPSI